MTALTLDLCKFGHVVTNPGWMPWQSSHEWHASGLSRCLGTGTRPLALGRPMILNDCNPNQAWLPSCLLCHLCPP